MFSAMFMLDESTFAYRSYNAHCNTYPTQASLVDHIKEKEPKAYDIAIMGITMMSKKEFKKFNSEYK